MNTFVSHIKKLLSLFGLLAIGFLWQSCSNDDLDYSDNYQPWNDPNKVCLPLSISFESNLVSTKATGDLVNGEDFENDVDFDKTNECFAIFFDKDKKVKTIEPLYLSEQLTSSHDSSEDLGERTYMAIAYVNKDDVEGSNPHKYIMVVLNGGKIFNQIKDSATPGKTLSDVLKIAWFVDQEDQASDIGKNTDGLYTMSNSAYFESGQLATITPLTATNYYTSIDDYLKNNGTPAAKVYVERMVAKFSEPKLVTEVIGSERFFRPSDEATKLVIYHWEGESLVSEELDWRIHLLGWAINGEETSSFVFKNIPTTTGSLSDWTNWNDTEKKRSYWSVDPHYNTGFYPWQYRKAADREDIISYSAAISNGTAEYKPVLKYYTFNEVEWQETMTTPENTIDPSKNDWNLDDREYLLAGPHLLLTAELYLEGESGGIYLNNFGPVSHLFCDRIQRYYKEEKELFKMFVRDFNYTLSTQEQINFHVHDWGNPDNKEDSQYLTKPSGECRLYYEKGGVNRRLTNELVDEIFSDPDIHLYPANVRQGDGRVIPWIPGLNVRKPDGTSALSFELKDGTDLSNNGKWTDDMYRSLFYEWFGPIDHYNGGKMYYAGEIKHHNFTDNSQTVYYGTVRNHWYKFTVSAINSLGTPVDDADQRIIPDKYDYNDQISVYIEIIGWHFKDTQLNLGS